MQEPWTEPQIVRRLRKTLERPISELGPEDLGKFRDSDRLLFDNTGLMRLASLYGWLDGRYGCRDHKELAVGLNHWLTALTSVAADVAKSAQLAVLSDGGLMNTFKVSYLRDPEVGKEVVDKFQPQEPITGFHVLGHDNLVTHYMGPHGLTPLYEGKSCIPAPTFRLYTVCETRRLAFTWPTPGSNIWEFF